MPIQDFDTYHTGSPGPPPGWVGVTTGSGAITYNQDVQGGSVTLATGATQDSEALLYLDSNVLIPNDEGSFQFHLSAISAVTSVTIRCGLMLRADWALTSVAGALPALPGNDYLVWDLTIATSANWFMRFQRGATGTVGLDSGLAGVTTSTKLISWIDQASFPNGYVNGVEVRQTTPATGEVPNVLLSPGIVISNTSAADRTVTIDMIQWQGRRA